MDIRFEATIKDFIINNLSKLNREIVNAANDGDIIQKNIIDTKYETLEELCAYIRKGGYYTTIVEDRLNCEEYGFDIQFDGIIDIPQFSLIWKGNVWECHNFAYQKLKER